MYKPTKTSWALCSSSKAERQGKLKNNTFDVERTAIAQQVASDFLVLCPIFWLLAF